MVQKVNARGPVMRTVDIGAAQPAKASRTRRRMRVQRGILVPWVAKSVSEKPPPPFCPEREKSHAPAIHLPIRAAARTETLWQVSQA